MRKVIFIQRNKKAGFSIDKVARPIIENTDNKEELSVPSSGACLQDLFKNLIFVLKHRDKKAIHHITGDIHYCLLSLIGCKTVLTVHDTVTLDYNTKKNIKYYIKKMLWYTIPFRIADRIVCISEETKKHVQKYTKRDDIIVIHNSVDPNIKHIPAKSFGAKFKALIIGTKQNKNLERTLEALSIFDCRVTIIGKLSKIQSDLIEKLQIDVTNKYNLSDEELRQEYYNCDLVLFCSLFEGFGMPLLEANKAGRPVICSNIPVLKEVGGNAAIYVDPYSVEAIKDGISKLVKDEDLQHSLIDFGLSNSERHEISALMGAWNKVYNSLD